jgi:uncharacterized protein YlxP (DUF503 family)
MTVGIYSFELHLPAARSLKDKRQVLRRLKDRLRAHYNIALAETGEHLELWQRAALTVVSVADRREPLERLFEAVHREAQKHVPGEVIETGVEYLDGADGGVAGWSDSWE